MKRISVMHLFILAALFVAGLSVAGCSSGEEKKAVVAAPVIAPGPVSEIAAPALPSSTEEKKIGETGVAMDVDGVKLTTKALDKEVEEKLVPLKGQIPPESMGQAKAEIRQGIMDDFVLRTLLKKEISRQKITAGDQEIGDILKAMKANLPAGVTLEDLLKKNNIDPAKIREEITLNIQINKLILAELGGKVTISDKEIADFYQKNKGNFTKPETVHARHLLIATEEGEAEKSKAGKKAKAEDLRKQLLAGADFAVLAKKHSDCPSKEKGGDLGSFARGQMVKPFEDAAFSQSKDTIGPVVMTDFGFHIIQVLEHEASQVMPLDAEIKKKITPFLEQQKQQGAFEGLVKRLKAKANIVVSSR